MCVTQKSTYQLAVGRSEIQASKGSDMLRSPSKWIEANHCLEYLYYFRYLALSSSTLLDAFFTGAHMLMASRSDQYFPIQFENLRPASTLTFGFPTVQLGITITNFITPKMLRWHQQKGL
jgi:hypothetical protein